MKKVFHRDENVFSPRWKKIFMQHHVKPDHRHFFKVWRTRSDYEVYPTVSFVFAIPPESGWLALAAYQHRRKLGNAMLRKSERHVASSSPTLWGRKLRPQRSIFFFRQFKHKIARETFCITPNSFFKSLCLGSVHLSQIKIKHHLLAPDLVYLTLYYL